MTRKSNPIRLIKSNSQGLLHLLGRNASFFRQLQEFSEPPSTPVDPSIGGVCPLRRSLDCEDRVSLPQDQAASRWWGSHVCSLRALLVFQNQLSGNLLRKFKNSNGWQKLWVVFTNFCLFFYKSHQVRAAHRAGGLGDETLCVGWGEPWGPPRSTLPLQEGRTLPLSHSQAWREAEY